MQTEIAKLAAQFDVSEESLQSVMDFCVAHLKESKHMNMFISDPEAWLTSAFIAWKKKGDEFYNAYLNDPVFAEKVNEEVYNKLRN